MSLRKPQHHVIRRSNLLIQTTLDHCNASSTADQNSSKKQLSREDILSDNGATSTVSSNNALLRTPNSRTTKSITPKEELAADGCLISCFPNCKKPVYHPGQIITGRVALRPAFRVEITGTV